jgi:hypothetical protein
MMKLAFAILAVFSSTLIGAPAQYDLETVRKRIAEIEPKAEEKRFDEIGWAKDIREARRLSAQHNRPVFLFTHDGRINIGRC